MTRTPAAEARQGVVADAGFFYGIDNHPLGKYHRQTGEKVGAWACPKGEPLIPLNAGILHEGRLTGFSRFTLKPGGFFPKTPLFLARRGCAADSFHTPA